MRMKCHRMIYIFINQKISGMNYLHQIIWYLTLPLTIAISYYAVLKGLKWLNKSIEKEQDN